MTGVPSYQPPVSAGGVGGVAPPAAVNKAPPRKRGGISIINPNTGKSIFDQSSNDKEATGKEDQDAAEVKKTPFNFHGGTGKICLLQYSCESFEKNSPTNQADFFTLTLVFF